jgi:hypothetical protein
MESLMKSSYHIDPTKYSLDRLQNDLLARDLIPSRQPLKAGLNEKFTLFHLQGWKNLADLKEALKNKDKIAALSDQLGINVDYLTLLRREVNSYFPNPVSLQKFKRFSLNDIQALADYGIKNSKHLFEWMTTNKDLTSLSRETGIDKDVLEELGAVCDLVRAYGVGPAFARILYDTGIHSIHDLSNYSAKGVVRLYEEQTNKKADFTESDIQFSLDMIEALQIG